MTTMEISSSSEPKKISSDDVISKIKEDGDFDTLRLKIVRKVKDNAALRDSIVSAIKQSEAINRPGAEKLKPRQLSDAIHEEIRIKVMSQISGEIWEVIRSRDGVKNEIMETVKCVYSKLLSPKVKEANENASPSDNKEAHGPGIPAREEGTHDDEKTELNDYSACDHLHANVSPGENKNPPGFSPSNLQQSNGGRGELELPSKGRHPSEEVMFKRPNKKTKPSKASNKQISADRLPGLSASAGDSKFRIDESDEDPDVPPGFG